MEFCRIISPIIHLFGICLFYLRKQYPFPIACIYLYYLIINFYRQFVIYIYSLCRLHCPFFRACIHHVNMLIRKQFCRAFNLPFSQVRYVCIYASLKKSL